MNRELWQQISGMNLQHWPEDAFVNQKYTKRLYYLMNIYSRMNPFLKELYLTPEEVFRRGLLTQLMDCGQPAVFATPVMELKQKVAHLITEYRTKAIALGYDSNKAMLRQVRAEILEMREFLHGIDFESQVANEGIPAVSDRLASRGDTVPSQPVLDAATHSSRL